MKVYDVTEYARDHPGGLDVLLEVAGKDATSEYEDVGHSQDASEIMQSFLVGVLEGYSEKSKDDNSVVAKSASEISKSNSALARMYSSWTDFGRMMWPFCKG